MMSSWAIVTQSAGDQHTEARRKQSAEPGIAPTRAEPAWVVGAGMVEGHLDDVAGSGSFRRVYEAAPTLLDWLQRGQGGNADWREPGLSFV